jgi:hypothetical protein
MSVNGKTSARGYGWRHQKLRESWSRVVASGGAVCAWCGLPIVPGEPWDLGHVDGSERTMYQGPEHRKCNRGARPGRAGGVADQQGVAPWLSPPDENGYRRPWSCDWGGGTPTGPDAAQ